MKKGILIVLGVLMSLFLAACSGAEESSSKNVDEDLNSTTNVKQEREKEVSKEADADVFKAASGKNNKMKPSKNLFDKNKVFQYKDGSIVMTLNKAEFTKKFSASNADPNDIWAVHEIANDSQIYLHLTGTIKNDTTDSFSFGNVLGEINFSLLYDGKHEFDNNSTAETENGTKLGPSGIDALTEGDIHVYFTVPKPVSETEKPLVLTVYLGEESFEIPLR